MLQVPVGLHSGGRIINEHIGQLIGFDDRHDIFKKAMRFINYELIGGDIVEFGVYTGRSLALLSYYHEAFKETVHGDQVPQRLVIGVDSFRGLPKNAHVRWREGTFRTNRSYHPTIATGELVTRERVAEFFAACGLPAPVLLEGYFESMASPLKQATKRIALLHIDCDLYESTLQALTMCSDTIQDGCVVLFDDWFNFRASRTDGEQKAFTEFLKGHRQFEAIPYQPYVTFGYSFILKTTHGPQ